MGETIKKVLVIGISANVGGVEKFILNYCNNLKSDNLKFDFLINIPNEVLKNEIEKIGKIYSITTMHSKHPIKFKKQMEKIILDGKYDAIWLNDCSLNAIHYLKIAKDCGVKTRIIHSHNSKNMDNSLKGKLRYIKHLINKMRISKIATDYWACSISAAQFFYPKNIIENKLKIIKNAIDVQKFEFNEKIRNDIRKELNIENNYVIGNVGRFHFQKNQEFLVKFFKKYLSLDNSAILLLIGVGEDLDKIKSLVKELDIEKNVKFLGLRNDVNKIMQAMDVFVLPSKFEGLPIVGIEAETSGLPCLFSEEITSKLKICDNVEFLPINKEEPWIQKLEQYKNKEINRVKAKYDIIKNGFDLKEQTKEIKNFFMKN